jgi:hypothetical protein
MQDGLACQSGVVSSDSLNTFEHLEAEITKV